jgi:hypothetical protein
VNESSGWLGLYLVVLAVLAWTGVLGLGGVLVGCAVVGVGGYYLHGRGPR